jgi:hypothetical protein
MRGRSTMGSQQHLRSAPILAIAFLAACVSSSSGSVGHFVNLVREVHYDFTVYESPRALADAAELVVVGTLSGVSAGRHIESIGTHATLQVAVDRVLKGSPDLLTDGKVFVEIRTTPIATVEAYRASLPAVRVLLFLDDRTDIKGTGETGAPAGARIFAPWATGIVFEQAEGFAVAYEDLGAMPDEWQQPASFDDLVLSLE